MSHRVLKSCQGDCGDVIWSVLHFQEVCYYKIFFINFYSIGVNELATVCFSYPDY